MNGSAAASFINLDLELESDEDLAPLAAHFGNKVFVLHCEEDAGRFRLALEAVIRGALSEDAAACTEHFLTLLDALPPPLQALWQRCDRRVFDYGFEGGTDGPPCLALLGSDQLRRIAGFAADLRITVYPFQPSTADAADVPE